jgi:hypothetical protein
LQEYFREDGPPSTTVVKQVSQLKDGYLQIPETPGIGMELDDHGIAGLPHNTSPGDGSPGGGRLSGPSVNPENVQGDKHHEIR